ncbi:GNAT family N-acetyltransferase [Pontibacter saemangeumensis]|uniref:GNAT family N-acetyltransferase n=2 Tax=Pontibacter saemangeumensis TaxID=1084525 RepID=A0ABP8M0S0_9BACT
MLPAHYAQVREIYNLGIATNNATFEREAPAWEEWDHSHMQSCRLVLLVEGRVAGWAALTPVSGRCVYRGVAEDSVYVHPDFKGRGFGKLLLRTLVEASEQEGIWTLQAGIFRENHASIRLHEACGFRLVGVRERIGQLHGQWRDTVLMERRSNKIGI